MECLNRVFGEFDRLVGSYGLEKIKTSGDAYMVVSGVPRSRPDHAEVLADFALAMRDMAMTLPNSQGSANGHPHWNGVRPGSSWRDWYEQDVL